MSAIGLETSDHFVRSQHIASLDDQSRDWELVLRESHHRMKNTLTLLGASVRRDFSRPGTRDMSGAVDRFEQRIVAFGRLYQLLSDSDSLTAVSVEAFFENLCEALSEAVLEPAGIRCEAAIESGALPASQCHRLALMLTELVTNAAKHAFPDRNDALIRIEMANRDGAWLCTVADNGIGATGPLQGTGSRILEGLARSIDARLQGEASQGGTRVTIVMPTAA
ncbi:two-component sensor histidine kinase [Bradyrhizobium japonicum]|uniref:sensor histidine kinase n=1 Tax=Bradyrhizobium TaxID=374 RepID=UPI0004844BC4|nr:MULTISPECIES: sensor histidine kinase [Bradyrhizobium]MBR0877789.1 sensor histidine kinase [Bradyrhizobium liaoningense]MBR0945071.1 sensor histidine kinase [Bradyrhizobium liaoningense]MBR0997753.1 sensor histidine kinase [Bradyrhizobium liaoningense]MBR1028147.1 sensor histidine kinase [Bradyrhizobium liaoningense]MBR1066486.1 sensor histidine kinase [Bradyrhizobium liaoningense]